MYKNECLDTYCDYFDLSFEKNCCFSDDNTKCVKINGVEPIEPDTANYQAGFKSGRKSRDEEIKQLRDLLDRALPEIKIYTGSIKRHKGFTLYSEIVKALKEE